MSPTIAISMGDPAGIGPEVIVKTVAKFKSTVEFNPFVVGSCSVLRDTVEQLGINLDIVQIQQPVFQVRQGQLPVLELDDIYRGAFPVGVVDPLCGDLSYKAVVKAAELCLSKQVDALVTAPISKEAWHQAGHHYDGHTGLLAELTRCDNYRMTFASDRLNVMLTTTHIPLSDISRTITIKRVYETIKMGEQFIKSLGNAAPRIAVCGLNPHAGESGIFGHEDESIVKPAVQAAIDDGLSVFGPLPSDTIFRRALKGEFDLVVAQYHDQGLIPVKLVAFDSAVNITVGLPIIRTSVDHGTAFDIAGQGIADHQNMRAAIDYAVKMSKGHAAGTVS
jgi:4-hydroxythreonine-4-phosphate dehydrogenase